MTFIFYPLILLCSLLAFSSIQAQWIQQVSNVSPPKQIDGMYFSHPDSGFIVGGGAGGGGFIRRTTNGGVQWTTINHPLPSTVNFSEVVTFGNIVYVFGFDYWNLSGYILKSVNAGFSWQVQVSGNYSGLLGGTFLNKDTGFAVGYGGVILRTQNGGVNWSQIPSGVSDNLRDISFPESDTGYIVAEYNNILKSLDNGQTWAVMPSGTSSILVACHFINGRVGFTSGGSQVMKTTDGGVNWTLCPFSFFIQDIFFSSDSVGFGVGSYGQVLQTINGGVTWLPAPISGFGIDGLYSVYFLNDTLGFCGGYDGKVFKTTTGGTPSATVGNEENTGGTMTDIHVSYCSSQLLVSVTEPSLMEIIDMKGKTRIESLLSEGTNVFQGYGFSSGIYVVRITSNGRIYTQRIVFID